MKFKWQKPNVPDLQGLTAERVNARWRNDSRSQRRRSRDCDEGTSKSLHRRQLNRVKETALSGNPSQ